jgi:hypothetical protein
MQQIVMVELFLLTIFSNLVLFNIMYFKITLHRKMEELYILMTFFITVLF